MFNKVIRRFFWATSFLAVATTPASAGDQPPRLFTGQGISWMLKPQAINAQTEVSRVQLGSFLFVQPLQPTAEAVPEPGQTGALPGLVHTTAATAQLDTHRLIAVTGGLTVTPFCTLNGITRPGQRLCLIDTNADGTFDYQTRAFGLGDGKSFNSMMFARPEPASIRYKVKEGLLNPVMSGGIVLREEGSAFSVRFAISEGGKPKVLDLFRPGSGLFSAPERRKALDQVANRGVLNGATQKFTAQQLPLKIGLFGAVAEIIDIGKGTVTYRMLSAFDPAEVLPISRAGTLPVTP